MEDLLIEPQSLLRQRSQLLCLFRRLFLPCRQIHQRHDPLIDDLLLSLGIRELLLMGLVNSFVGDVHALVEVLDVIARGQKVVQVTPHRKEVDPRATPRLDVKAFEDALSIQAL